MKKRLFSALMVLAIFISCSATFSANATTTEVAYEEPIIERYESIGSISYNFNIANGTAYISARLKGLNSSVTSCSITLSIQEKNNSTWITRRSWSKTSSGRTLSMSESYGTTSGKTYRAKITATVYTASGSETTTLFSDSQIAN